jgi:hypothetical protein
MIHQSNFNFKGYITIDGQHIKNQVTTAATKAVLDAIGSGTDIHVSNVVLLTGFALPSGKTLKDLVLADVLSYASHDCVVGNNGNTNPDGSRDMLITRTVDAPYLLQITSRIPANKGNATPYINAAVLIINGDVTKSVSNGTVSYVATGTDTAFSVVMFDAYQKSNTQPLVFVWSLQMTV